VQLVKRFAVLHGRHCGAQPSRFWPSLGVWAANSATFHSSKCRQLWTARLQPRPQLGKPAAPDEAAPRAGSTGLAGEHAACAALAVRPAARILRSEHSSSAAAEFGDLSGMRRGFVAGLAWPPGLCCPHRSATCESQCGAQICMPITWLCEAWARLRPLLQSINKRAQTWSQTGSSPFWRSWPSFKVPLEHCPAVASVSVGRL
jgi:hypothetical protein